MAVTEKDLSELIAVLVEKLASADLIRLARSEGIFSELHKWFNTLTQIQAVLFDAGQKQSRDSAIQLWLNKCRHLAYDIDDELDDLATKAMRRQLNQQSHASISKVLKFVPFKFHALKYGRKMSSNIDEIKSKLQDLIEEKDILGLISNVERSITTSLPRPGETSLVDVSQIMGRERDKEALLEILVGNESCDQKLSIVSIVGLGGIGKTTLARLLYSDEKVKDHFELTSWVRVSDEFNLFNISKAIFKDVGGDDRKFETLFQLQVALSEKLSNKRFLIVLDDVWNEDYREWELLQRPFVAGAATGSKVIVTTRNNMVASVMDSIQTYPLELLSNNEALSLFAQHALGEQNFDSNPTLKLYGESIVKKCGRLPLALITLGRVLRRKTNEEEWEELLNSEIWNLQNKWKVLPALGLSYNDLPLHLKQMFAYCCLFPKDYLFEKDELVLLWMAEGFLLKSNGSKSMESFGRDCFEELESRSFFQHSTIEKYTMHDLLSDLSMSVAGEFYFMLDDKSNLFDENESLEKFRHFSFTRQEYGVYRRFKALERARSLRTFLAISFTRSYAWQEFFLSNKILVELLPQLPFLRVLSLANYSITEVPPSICSLKHLRYLNFSKTSILCLPEQIGGLYNLQSLLLSGCHKLSSLSNSFVKLVNLRHLDISATPELNETPVGIGGLTGLRTLSKVIIGGDSGFKISDLKDLLHLQGQLSVKGLHKVINATHAKEANLKQKEGLLNLELDWSGDVFDDTRNERVEYEVLKGLRPGDKLRSLKILYYRGTKFPSWVGDPTFVCLSELTLRGCLSCTCIPTLGHLPMLQKLFLDSMNGLTRLGWELLGTTRSCNGIAFPSLEFLGFRDMQGWEEWSTSNGNKDGIIQLFPRLHEISIVNCTKLDLVAIDLIPSFKILHVNGCSVAVVRSMVGVSSSIIRLTLGSIKGLTQLPGEILECLQTVKYLSISKCDELIYLCGSEAEACDIIVSLQTLKVSDCVNLLSLAERNVNLVIREVAISNCPKLERYNCPKNIEKLDISGCDSMTSFIFPPMDDLPCTLRVLKVGGSENLELNWLFSNFLSSLGALELFNVSNVRFFPEGCLVHLTNLKILCCDNIESIPEKGFGFLPLLCLRSLWIMGCQNIKSIPHEHLQSLTSLQLMWIYNCPSMDFPFPSGMWPPDLSVLGIGMLKKGMTEWGMQHFPTSLCHLHLDGENSEIITFATKAEEEVDIRRNSLSSSSSSSSSSFLLPSSLTRLCIDGFEALESVSKGMEHLTCLEELDICDCPNLRDLPEKLLPSLSRLIVKSPSRELLNKCSRRRKGKYWPIISQIPRLEIVEDNELYGLGLLSAGPPEYT